MLLNKYSQDLGVGCVYSLVCLELNLKENAKKPKIKTIKINNFVLLNVIFTKNCPALRVQLNFHKKQL